MRPPSVLLIDIDGTLVDYSAQLPESAAIAVRKAHANGHRVYLCTGRSKAEIYPYLWDLGIDGLIGGNGSYIEDGGQVVHHQVLDPDVVQRAVEWMLTNDLGFYLECNSGLYASDNFPEKAARILDGGATPKNVQWVRDGFPHMIYGTRSGRADVNKISFVLEPQVDLMGLTADYAGQAQVDTWSLTGKGPEFGEFGQLGVHKGAAVRQLAEHLGVSTDAMIGFGDARSDLELITVCGTGVAMGNADPVLKAAADLVTDDVTEDGLNHAFAELRLI